MPHRDAALVSFNFRRIRNLILTPDKKCYKPDAASIILDAVRKSLEQFGDLSRPIFYPALESMELFCAEGITLAGLIDNENRARLITSVRMAITTLQQRVQAIPEGKESRMCNEVCEILEEMMNELPVESTS